MRAKYNNKLKVIMNNNSETRVILSEFSNETIVVEATKVLEDGNNEASKKIDAIAIELQNEDGKTVVSSILTIEETVRLREALSEAIKEAIRF